MFNTKASTVEVGEIPSNNMLYQNFTCGHELAN